MTTWMMSDTDNEGIAGNLLKWIVRHVGSRKKRLRSRAPTALRIGVIREHMGMRGRAAKALLKNMPT
jgi:hypothetical protein